MGEDGLFDDLPACAVEEKAAGKPRLREPVRDQIELRAVDLDALIGADHAARTIWAYVERLDLGALEEGVRARTHTPGQAPPTPRLLLALWLYATSEGVGSARALARLCTSHDAYRWLCGGVRVNYHGLSDFRSGQAELLDRLLSENLATLSAAGVIDLDEVVQDGVRVRAAAGSASYRRRKTLHKELKKARRLVERLARESEDDPDASNRRIAAARQRAARARAAGGGGAGQAGGDRSGAYTPGEDQQGGGEEAERAARLDDGLSGAGDEDGRWRFPAGLQLPARHGGRGPDRDRGRGRGGGLGSRADPSDA